MIVLVGARRMHYWTEFMYLITNLKDRCMTCQLKFKQLLVFKSGILVAGKSTSSDNRTMLSADFNSIMFQTYHVTFRPHLTNNLL